MEFLMKTVLLALLASLGIGSQEPTHAQIIAALSKPAARTDALFKSRHKTTVILVRGEKETKESHQFNSIDSIMKLITALWERAQIDCISVEYSNSQGRSSLKLYPGETLNNDLKMHFSREKYQAPRSIRIEMTPR